MKNIVIGSFALLVSLVGGNAFAQGLPACRPAQSYCNSLTGHHTYHRTVLPAAASLNECAPGTQSPIGDCDATLLRTDGTNGYTTAGVSTIQQGQQWIVRTPVVSNRPTVVARRDSRYPGLERRVTAVEGDVDTLDDNLDYETEQRLAAQRLLFHNDRVLARGMNVNRTDIRNVGWQVGDLREEFRVRFFAPLRYTWQSGGSPTFGLGLGVGITRWGQGSPLGVDAHLAFNGYEMQPLAPGRTPLFGMSAGIHMVIGRSLVQGLLGFEGGTAFRFGDAGPNEVTGGTAFDIGFGGGVRGEMPFYPASRPNGARFFGQITTHMGLGGSNVLVTGQDPLHIGFALSVHGMLGVAL